MVGSQNRAQRSQICGNKQDLINLLIAGLNHTPFLKSTPHPAPLFLRFLQELRSKCAPLFHFQLLQPVASVGKLASGFNRSLSTRGRRSGTSGRQDCAAAEGRAGRGRVRNSLIPHPASSSPPPTPRPPQQPGGKFLLPPSEYKPKKAPHSISPREIVVLSAL